MGKFLTAAARIAQLPQKGMYKLIDNELFQDDDGNIYLAWRGFTTDNFTWINSADWDIRCAHGHDVGCKYHQVVRVKLNKKQLQMLRYLRVHKDKIVCENIAPKFLEVVDVSGHWINNFFYRMLKAADCPKTPKYIQILYRCGVAFNFGWFKSGKEKIDLKNLNEK